MRTDARHTAPASAERNGAIQALYICYFGLREPLVQTQVLPYLQELATRGARPTLLTFEPKTPGWTAGERQQRRDSLERLGIRWISLRYHKFPSLPATLYDVLLGNVVACYQVFTHRLDVIHARGYVPAAMATIAQMVGRVKLIFDIRGFMPEEYVDAGLWPEGGVLYRITKAAERRFLASADGFVVLTNRAREILFPGCFHSDSSGRPIAVIPCCVDMRRFAMATDSQKDTVREKLKLTGRRVVVYVGALGGWYLSSEMAEFIAVAHERDPAVFALVLSQSRAQMAWFEQRLRQLGVAREDYRLQESDPQDVPEFLAAGDYAFCFIKPGYSKQASSPTKIGEFLASGLPVLCNSGIGDVDHLLLANRVGLVIENFDRESYLRALEEMDEMTAEIGIRQRCRNTAQNSFDLRTVAGARYQGLYARLCLGQRASQESERAA